jgi:hypothetical protein
MIGTAATTDPMPNNVSSCPASASETPRLALICGSRPAGRISVMMAMKPDVVKASRPMSGS